MPDDSGRIARRSLLLGAAAGAGLMALPGCSKPGAASGKPSLKVSTYGGNFEQAMSQYVYPAFEKATGIAVESIAQPSGLQFLLQLIESNKAGQAPMDLCISGTIDVLRGRKAGLWRPHDPAKLAHLGNLPAEYVSRGADGIDGVGVVGWYLTMVCNPQTIKPTPNSWAEMWAPTHRDAWGLNGGIGYLWEITAKTFFGDTSLLGTEEGIRKVVAKMAGLKPNTKLWWDSEGTMQTALENGEVQGGVYFADVAQTMVAAGTPLEIIYPKEGPVIDFGSWCQPTSSKKVAEAAVFVDWMLTPEAQGLAGSKVNAPPLIKRELLTLPPAEIARITSPVTPIPVNVSARAEHLDFMASQFNEMVAT